MQTFGLVLNFLKNPIRFYRSVGDVGYLKIFQIWLLFSLILSLEVFLLVLKDYVEFGFSKGVLLALTSFITLFLKLAVLAFFGLMVLSLILFLSSLIVGNRNFRRMLFTIVMSFAPVMIFGYWINIFSEFIKFGYLKIINPLLIIVLLPIGLSIYVGLNKWKILFVFLVLGVFYAFIYYVTINLFPPILIP